MANLVFPTELEGQIEDALRYNKDRPFMTFKTVGGKVRIRLPIPGGLSFSDSAEYSSIDLGAIGGAIDQVGQSLKDNGFTDTITKGKAGAFTPSGIDTAKIAGMAVASQSETGKKVLFATKEILNPNTNTTFTGVGIRSFSFSFKLIGRTQQDSVTIRDIHETFREYTYPESDSSSSNVILNYPEIWEIKFHTTNNGIGENPYIPKIYECYLTGMDTSLNSSAAMFRRDGAPVEIDFTLNFSETRSLIRQDFTQGTGRRVRLNNKP